ncbi:MAG: queuosine precursor transporter [Fluviicola sp.]
MLETRKQIAFQVMAGIFITSAIVAELISCKSVPTFIAPIIAGIVPWPIVFLLTDVMNEYFGQKAVKRLSWITTGMIVFCFLLVYIAVEMPTDEGSYMSDTEFRKAFGGSLPIMIGSITAFIVSQLIDVRLFHMFNKLLKGRWIWVRSTGSTVISQLADGFIVIFIGFYLPGTFNFQQILEYWMMGYAFKLMVAVSLTPLIYLMHYLARTILGAKSAVE